VLQRLPFTFEPQGFEFPCWKRKSSVDKSQDGNQSQSDAWDILSDSRSLWFDGHFLIFNPSNRLYNLWWQLSVLLTYWNLFQVSWP
jgi:hypothetical protein